MMKITATRMSIWASWYWRGEGRGGEGRGGEGRGGEGRGGEGRGGEGRGGEGRGGEGRGGEGRGRGGEGRELYKYATGSTLTHTLQYHPHNLSIQRSYTESFKQSWGGRMEGTGAQCKLTTQSVLYAGLCGVCRLYYGSVSVLDMQAWRKGNLYID